MNSVSKEQLIWTESHNQLMAELGALTLPPFPQATELVKTFLPRIGPSAKRGSKYNGLHSVQVSHDLSTIPHRQGPP